MGLPELKSDRVYTYADYALWDDGQRWELIDGVPCAMTPGPGTMHQKILSRLSLLVGNFLQNGPCQMFFAPCDVLLPEEGMADEDVKDILQPDLFVVCDPHKVKEKFIFGAPDWVVEILSPSTAKKDQQQKRRVYEKAGVKEYWIVCPVYATVSVFRLIAGRLELQQTFDGADEIEVTVLPGLKMSAADFLPPVKCFKEEFDEIYQNARRI